MDFSLRACGAVLLSLLLTTVAGCGTSDLPTPGGDAGAFDGPMLDGPMPDARRPDGGDGGDAGPIECAIDDDCVPPTDRCSPLRCDAGRCVPNPVICDDGDACTVDQCDPATGTCSAPRAADGTTCGGTSVCCAGACLDPTSDDANCGGCGIVCGANAGCSASACECDVDFLDCDGMPGCESSGPTDPANCGTCGIVCSGATPSCLGGTCAACTAASDCVEDGLSCTDTPTCAAGRCAYPAVADTCLVAGGCYATGDPDPANACMACDPAASATAFSARLGASCDDGTFCTDADACDASGTCAGSPRSCDDGLTCTADNCSEAMARCTYIARAGQCAIDGACFRSGDANPANPSCEACNTSTPLSWTPIEGVPCEDGDFCTVADSCSAAGTCLGLARDCSDTQSCTVDSCDESVDACVHPLGSGCMIGGVCYADGTTNPADPCLACDPASGAMTWTPRAGASCDDGRFCTAFDACDATGACIGAARVCDDTLSCTTDACNEIASACEATPTIDSCVIGGTCYANGTVDPTNPCRACIATTSRTDWSPRTGVSCDDGNYCTEVDACDATGSCDGTARACSDGNDCTADTCNETTNACESTLAGGSCVIGGVCYPSGGLNPGNDCQECRPATSTTAWTVRTGSSCDDTQFCTVSDTCTAAAACVGSANTCTDGVACTSDVCNEGADRCDNPVQAGFCLVGTSCVADGALNPANDCSACDAAVSQTAWSARTGARCVDGSPAGCGACTSGGVCSTASTCNDSLGCTADACDDATATCTATVNAGSCAISGACYAGGTVDPTNPCRSCDPVSSSTSWTARTGARCSDGSIAGCGACNTSGLCATVSTCSDGQSCTADTCDDTTGVCTYPVGPGSCMIGGACYAAMAVNAGNACLWCDPVASPTSWSPRIGTRCNDGTTSGCGVCSGSAICVTDSTCFDGLPCTTDACDDAAGTCGYTIAAATCAIDGACYASGATNPGNPCEGCNPATSPAAWSARTGARCDDGSVAGCGACTAAATCATGTTCSDGQACTTDTCTDATGVCSYPAAAGSCLIGGTCYASGATNGPCQFCDGTLNPSGWTNRPTTTRCDDGMPAGCGQCSAAGVCGTTSTCSDVAACTTDTCDDTSGACSFAVTGGCLISSVCYADGTVNPGNACQVCTASSSTTTWTARTGLGCDDSNADGCGTCSVAGVCTTTSMCTDGLACTTDTCTDSSGACSYPVTVGSCAISGACYANGVHNPSNVCQFCNAAASASAWSADTGARCDDLTAAGCGTCSAVGACSTTSTCADSLSCTTDTCADATGSCTNTVAAGNCVMDSACWANGAVNPSNQCESCNVASSTAAWTPRTGVACDDGFYCFDGDTCNSSGTCVSTARDCDDAVGCTADSCNEATDMCEHSLAGGSCTIGGTCYPAMGANPANQCQWCDPATSTSAWTTRTGLGCNDSNVAGCGICSAAAVCATVSTCNDGLTCTTDTCTDATSTCTAPIAAAQCLIAGVCRAQGYVSPGTCSTCNTAISNTAFSPLTAMTVCRAAASMCDVQEVCSGSSLSCPGDGFASAGTPCRAVAGMCDAAENCTGASGTCPSDSYLFSGECRASQGDCDPAESCNGSGVACPSDMRYGPATVCRPTAGLCDAAESCNGVSTDCPSDAYASGSTVCRPAINACDRADNCTGGSVSCPGDAFQPSTASCGALADANPRTCQSCSGTNATCMTRLSCADDGLTCTTDVCTCGSGGADCSTGNMCTAPVTTGCLIGGVCRATGFVNPTNDCQSCIPGTSTTGYSASPATTTCNDGSVAGCGRCTTPSTCGTFSTCSDVNPCTTESCTDSSGACTFPPGNPGVSCRLPVNACDLEEFCTGASSTCPANVYAASGAPCTDSVVATCESCIGGAATCTNRTTCGTPSASCASNACTCGGASCLSGNTCTWGSPGTSGCLIANTCYAAGTGNPANPCEVCTPTTSAVAWSPRPTTTTCNDGSVAGCGRCNAVGVCATFSTCSDGNVCSTDTCTDATGVCTYPPGPTVTCRPPVNGCDIGENCTGSSTVCPIDVFQPASRACFAPDGLASTCQSCSGTAATCTTWTTCATAGAGCAANTCTCGANCSTGNTCTYPGTGCLISSACYANGALNPANPCQRCWTATSTSAWSPVVLGGGCVTDANAATCQHCLAPSTCTLTTTCGVGLTCTPGSPDTCS